MPELPTPGGDLDTWGEQLNEFLSVSLNPDGTLAPVSGPFTINVPISADSDAAGLIIRYSGPTALGAGAIIYDSDGNPIAFNSPAGGWKVSGDRNQAGPEVTGPFVSLDGTTTPPSILSAPSVASGYEYGSGGRFWLANGSPATEWVSGVTQVNDLWMNFAAGVMVQCTVSGGGTGPGTWVLYLPGSGISMPWLTVSGQRVLENGAIYRCTGYNCDIMCAINGASYTMTADQVDYFMSGLKPNSLIRVPAVAVTPASWGTALSQYDAVVAAAAAHGHRVAFMLTDFHGSYNDLYGVKTISWFTTNQYLHSVYGNNSYQDWITTIVTHYLGNPTVAIYDLCNEPGDGGGTNTAALATFASTASGWIKAINPNVLVYIAVGAPNSVGGNTQYQTINASMDFCGIHEYFEYAFEAKDYFQNAIALNKPLIFDEFGVWAKAEYDRSDLGPGEGGPATSYAARAAIYEFFMNSVFAQDACMGLLAFDYQPSSHYSSSAGSWGPYDQEKTRETIRNADLFPSPFTELTVSNLLGWFDAAGSLLYKPGTVIGGNSSPNAGVVTNVTYSGTTITIFTTTHYTVGDIVGIDGVVSTGTNPTALKNILPNNEWVVTASTPGTSFTVVAGITPTDTYTSGGGIFRVTTLIHLRWNFSGSGTNGPGDIQVSADVAPVASSVGKWPSYLMSPTSLMTTNEPIGGTYQAHSVYAVIYLTALPAGPDPAYLVNFVLPSTPPLFNVYIDSSGMVNITDHSTIIATGNIPVPLNQVSIIEAAWDATNQNYCISVNGQVAAYGLAASSEVLGSSLLAVGASASHPNDGFSGHLLELLHYGEFVPGTTTPYASQSRGAVLAYLEAKYGSFTGVLDLPTVQNAYGIPGNEWTVGNWYPGQLGLGTPVATTELTAYASPFVVNTTHTFAKVGTNVTGAGGTGSVVRFGIYADANGAPGNLVTDYGTVLTTGTGAVSVTASVTLTPGVYWLVVVAQGSASAPTLTSIGPDPSAVFFGSTQAAAAVQTGVFTTVGGAALPDPYGTPGGTLGANAMPYVQLQA